MGIQQKKTHVINLVTHRYGSEREAGGKGGEPEAVLLQEGSHPGRVPRHQEQDPGLLAEGSEYCIRI